MTLWFVLALMTAAAAFAVLWPLGRRTALRGGSDVAVYRDQLDEIARDRAAGRIGEREAEAARTEVSRRLLHSADAQPLAPAPGHALRRKLAALAALVLLPAGALGLYAFKGSPHLPDQPLAVRLDTPTEQSVPALVVRVEAHLERNPEDGRGWEVLAPVYMRLGRYEEAAQARRNVVRLLGSTAAREADLGEALTGAANGVVTADAKAAFERALALDATEFKARYFTGLAAEQDGRPAEAAKLWRALLDSAPPGANWLAFVQESLKRVDPNAPPPAAQLPGPSPDDVAAAETLTPEQRMAMVQGMIDRLAERLKADGRDADGWARLLRAYMVLGERERAAAALADARRALDGDPEGLRRIDELAKGLKIEG
jgi:cytochrome c-type biogenesis protein CcmH